MTQVQRVIKGIATAFAIFLAVVIISSIVGAVLIATNVTTWLDGRGQSGEDTGSYISKEMAYSNVTGLDISAGVYRVTIREGDSAKVELIDVSDKYEVKQKEDGVLKLSDGEGSVGTGISWLMNFLDGKKNIPFDGEIIVTVEAGTNLKECKVEAGTGELYIADIQTEELQIDSGTGEVAITGMEADNVKVEAGTGGLYMEDVLLRETKVEAGTGSVIIKGSLQGETKVESGTGAVILHLEDSYDSYEFDIEKGLGAMMVNGENQTDLQVKDSSKPNSLEIEGGVGSVEVNFAS